MKILLLLSLIASASAWGFAPTHVRCYFFALQPERRIFDRAEWRHPLDEVSVNDDARSAKPPMQLDPVELGADRRVEIQVKYQTIMMKFNSPSTGPLYIEGENEVYLRAEPIGKEKTILNCLLTEVD